MFVTLYSETSVCFSCVFAARSANSSTSRQPLPMHVVRVHAVYIKRIILEKISPVMFFFPIDNDDLRAYETVRVR